MKGIELKQKALNGQESYLDDRPLDLLRWRSGLRLLSLSESLLEPERSLCCIRRRPGDEPSLKSLLPEPPRPCPCLFLSADRLRPLLSSGDRDRLALDRSRRPRLLFLELERDRRRDFEPIINLLSLWGPGRTLSRK